MDGIGALMEQVKALAKEDKSGLGSVCEGVVTQAGKGNLAVRVGQLPELTKEDLSVNPYYSYHWTKDDGNPTYLRAGDRVLLLSVDGQAFYLACKVVYCT